MALGKNGKIVKLQNFMKRSKGAKHSAKAQVNTATRLVINPAGLKWKEVQIPGRLEDVEGFFGLEEIDDVEVARDDQTGAIQFRVAAALDPAKVGSKESSSLSSKEPKNRSGDDEWEGFDAQGPSASPYRQEQAPNEDEAEVNDHSRISGGNQFQLLNEENDRSVDVSAWKALELSGETLESLSKIGFSKPTPIQQAAITEIRRGQNVVGKASTGSGKTLAFGIPILEYFLDQQGNGRDINPREELKSFAEPIALIISPTRELAHQLSRHLTDLFSNVKAAPRVATVTGGLARLKQQRLIASANIIIGTPGRLWDIMSSMTGFTTNIKEARFLVLDEADRLLSDGHFQQLEEILDTINRKEYEEDVPKSRHRRSSKRQTLIFSATFEKDLQRKLASKHKPVDSKAQNNAESMHYLLRKIDFGEKPKFIDVDPTSKMARNLKEGILECDALEKDLYLYSLLLLNPIQKTLVFTNSISTVRRLVPLLGLLEITAFGLHSEMAQKARLRSIEKFSSPSASGTVLVASDVAARGLDVPSVERVVHYHVPRAADVYVHRSGRTARADKSGSSIMLCSPNEVLPVRRLVARVHNLKDDETASPADSETKFLRTLHLDRELAARIKPRVALAKRISDATVAKEKQSNQENWLRSAAEELGVEYDSEEFSRSGGTQKGRGMGRRMKAANYREISKTEMAAMRAELKDLLGRRINAGVSEKYLSAGGLNMADLLEHGKGAFLGQVNGLGFD